MVDGGCMGSVEPTVPDKSLIRRLQNRCKALEDRVKELEGRRCETCAEWATGLGIEFNGQVLDGWHPCNSCDACTYMSHAQFGCNYWKGGAGVE